MGVTGNGHMMMMMDKNSDQVAQMIQKWTGEKGLRVIQAPQFACGRYGGYATIAAP
jgi:hypothetical protein